MGAQGQTERTRPAGKRVLVVDDSTDSANMMALMLRLTGHEARTAHDGKSALEAAAAFAPEVAFLDIRLPDMSGYDLARRLRTKPGLEGLVLVALTGFDDEDDRALAREAGFHHHLVKPADPADVERILNQG